MARKIGIKNVYQLKKADLSTKILNFQVIGKEKSLQFLKRYVATNNLDIKLTTASSVKSVINEIKKIQPHFSRWETTPLSGKSIFTKINEAITEVNDELMLTDKETDNETDNEANNESDNENEQSDQNTGDQNPDLEILSKPIVKQFVFINPSESSEKTISDYSNAQKAAFLVYTTNNKEFAFKTLNAIDILRINYSAIISDAALKHLDKIISVIRSKFNL